MSLTDLPWTGVRPQVLSNDPHLSRLEPPPPTANNTGHAAARFYRPFAKRPPRERATIFADKCRVYTTAWMPNEWIRDHHDMNVWWDFTLETDPDWIWNYSGLKITGQVWELRRATTFTTSKGWKLKTVPGTFPCVASWHSFYSQFLPNLYKLSLICFEDSETPSFSVTQNS